MAKPVITQEQLSALLDKLYQQALSGIPLVETNCYQLAESYAAKNPDKKKAAKALVKWQTAKCATSGFVTSLGGLITLPAAIPANLASVLYVQLRMIAAIAILGGYDPGDDCVQAFIYMVLVGMSLSEFVKKPAVQIANKVSLSLVKKIPGEVLKRINKKVAFRLFTKMGTKGLINLSKLVPVVGGAVGGFIDLFSTKAVAARAIRMFLEEKPVEDLDTVITDVDWEEIFEEDASEVSEEDAQEVPLSEESEPQE